MTKEDKIKYGEIISKCWEDEEYKAAFLKDPEGVLQDKGIAIEEGVTYRVIEAPKDVSYFVLPHENVKAPVQALVKYLLNSVDQVDNILPDGVEIRVVQNTDDIRNLVLPASPKTMTRAEMLQVAGGKSDTDTTATNVVAQAEAVTEVVAVEATVAVSSLEACAEAVVVVVGAIVLI